MAQGSPEMLPETWQSYVTLDEARIGARTALRDARVLEVAIVEDHNKPLRLVEWIGVTRRRMIGWRSRRLRRGIESTR
jgi:hypothetical protein